MPRDMFGDVVEPSIKVGSQKWYTVPLSIVVHTGIIAAVVIIPLMAADVLPTPPLMMSFVAARTEHVRLAANVTSFPLRPPAVLARALASLDVLSHGRAELGIGAGAAWVAIESMGGRRLDPGEGTVGAGA